MNQTPVQSRLLRRIEAELTQAQQQGQQLRALCWRAQRATVLIRHGALAAAREELTALHQAAFASPHPELGAWLHLAEGQMAYYSNFDPSARDRLIRAEALAAAAACPAAQAQALSFLVQVAQAGQKVDELLRHAAKAFAVAAPDDGVARGRVDMLIGVVLHLADGQEAAQPWYLKARQHAASSGDDALTSAIIYNSAAMRVARLREAELADRASPAVVLMAGVDSIAHFDQAMGVASLDLLTPLARAQVLVATGDFAGAMKLYEAHLPEAISRGLERLGSSLLADLAWCRANRGETDLALAQARESELELDPDCHNDDRAMTHSRLAQVYAKLDQAADAERQQALADAAWKAWRDEQRQWREAVAASGLTPQ